MKLTREALEAFRDTVLHQRGALAENGMTNDQVNDVLSEFDACFETTSCQSAGAVASHECGSVPDGDKLDDLILAVSNASFDCGAFDMDADTETIEAYRKLNDAAHAAKAALRQYVMSGLGMQPPNNQPNLICKSCGVDRSKEDCKGDRLRCGLASVAHSDHVAVTSAEPESRLTAAQIAEIASWLDEASDDIDSWGGYASDYFAEKWNLSGAIQSYKDRATKVRALLAAQSGISSPSHRPNEQKSYVGNFGDTGEAQLRRELANVPLPNYIQEGK